EGTLKMTTGQSVPEMLPGGCKLIPLTVRGDQRGSLVALEGGSDVPFEIARIYYLFGTPLGVARGYHAHRSLVQWAICMSGSCTVALDDGNSRADVQLDTPSVALEFGPMVWREVLNFTPDAVLLVLASMHFD